MSSSLHFLFSMSYICRYSTFYSGKEVHLHPANVPQRMQGTGTFSRCHLVGVSDAGCGPRQNQVCIWPLKRQTINPSLWPLLALGTLLPPNARVKAWIATWMKSDEPQMATLHTHHLVSSTSQPLSRFRCTLLDYYCYWQLLTQYAGRVNKL